MTQPDPFEELAKDPTLRWANERYRAELRAEAQEYEQLAVKDLLRGRTLQEAVVDLCHRGDIVALVLDSRTLVGEILHAAGDLARVRTIKCDVDVSLRAVSALRIVEQMRSGGRSCLHGPTSFTARLFELEASGERIELSTRMPTAEVMGRISAVAIDHIVLRDDDGMVWFVPLHTIDCVTVAPL